MGKRGPKPRPTALRILEGNPSKRPLPKNEPKPPPIAPKCPHWLHKYGKQEWKRVAPPLERLGLLTQMDLATLVGYCQSFAMLREATEFMNEFGPTYALFERTETGAIKHDQEGKPVLRYMQQYPAVSIANKAMANIKAFSGLFGFSPSDRGQMHIPGADEEEDPMERLLSGPMP